MAIAYTPEVRDDLLEFMLGISLSGYFSQQSVHLAVYLLDRFFEVGAAGAVSVLYVPTALLWSASKFLGLSENALNATQMVSLANKHAKEPLERADLLHVEIIVLQTLGWKLYVKTGYDFWTALNTDGIFLNTDRVTGSDGNSYCLTEIDVKTAFEISSLLCDACAFEGEFRKFSYEMHGAAAWAAGRALAGIQDPWPGPLQGASHFTIDSTASSQVTSMRECYDTLLHFFAQENAQRLPLSLQYLLKMDS